jgi:hypothetical protein
MGDKIVKSKNLCCQPVVFPSLSLLKQCSYFKAALFNPPNWILKKSLSLLNWIFKTKMVFLKALCTFTNFQHKKVEM